MLLHGSHLRDAIRSAHIPTTAECYIRTVRLNTMMTIGGLLGLSAFFILSGFTLDLFGFSTANPWLWLFLFGLLVPGMYAFQIYYPVIVAQGMTNSQEMEWILPMMYIIIPAGAIVMIWILSLMLPPETLEVTRKQVVEQDFGSGIPGIGAGTLPGDITKNQDFIRRIEAQKQRNYVLERLKNPLRTYITSYDYSLVGAMILAGIISGLWYIGWFETVFSHNPFEGFLCVAIIGFMVPIVIAYEGRRWYVRNVEAHLPEFLRELSDMKDIGITLQEAIHRISGAKLGVLSSELSVASRDIQSGVYVNSALVRMEERIGLVFPCAGKDRKVDSAGVCAGP